MTIVDQPIALIAKPRPAPTALQGPEATPPGSPELLPLDAGEQYRFSFDMNACVGCHSCEVACAEQNDLPADVAWRLVGELEGGAFPQTRRFNLSMACNHCLEPTCLSGCPSEAYTKLENGIVQHHPDECIGCQYCIWNCPYEVPVFDRARKIVSKCDMCLPRLEAGQQPACVSACPTKAITVEPVNMAAWRAEHAEADAPGLPPSEITLSTTRVVLPADIPAGTAAVSEARVEPEDPHWPLIALTLLTQISLGTVAATVATQVVNGVGKAALGGASSIAFLAGSVALIASLLHLGRPSRALKAMRNLRRSWLSREVVLFSAFSVVSFAYAAVWQLGGSTARNSLGLVVGGAAVVVGAAGVHASGRIYLVPARPVWNSRRTLVAFFATAAATGPLVVLLCLDRARVAPAWIDVLLVVAGAATLVQVAVHVHLLRTTSRRPDYQHRGTAELLRHRFQGLFAGRLALAGVTLLLLAGVPGSPPSAAAGRLATALAVVALGELAGRYLFYVTVVPHRAAGSFHGSVSR